MITPDRTVGVHKVLPENHPIRETLTVLLDLMALVEEVPHQALVVHLRAQEVHQWAQDDHRQALEALRVLEVREAPLSVQEALEVPRMAQEAQAVEAQMFREAPQGHQIFQVPPVPQAPQVHQALQVILTPITRDEFPILSKPFA
jgi:hypothetical protein